MIKVLICFGTRPEIIKLAPIAQAMQKNPIFKPILCSTGQHAHQVTQMLPLFDLHCDEDLKIMQAEQTINSITQVILQRLESVVKQMQPDYVMVQGDTTSAFCAGLLAFYHHIPVLHLEAGLRSGDMQKPWPEEANRRMLAVLSRYHFAPTEADAQNLKNEGIDPDAIEVVGNSIVDALQFVRNKIDSDPTVQKNMQLRFPFIKDEERFILVTGHRRESHGGGHEKVFHTLRRIAQDKKISIVFPVHLNPKVKQLADRILADCPRVHLLEPVDYLEMQYLLAKCFFVITDSGGIQEEAPSYGKPLLVTREVTERMAGVTNGSTLLVGTDPNKLFQAAARLIDDAGYFQQMVTTKNPYGDGHAASRVCAAIELMHVVASKNREAYV